MPRGDLKDRTKAFALAVLRVVSDLPRDRRGDVIGRQMLRSGMSVAANYRSACRARSRRDFVAKMAIVEEEADESQFWLEVVAEGRLLDKNEVSRLRQEAGELVAIAVSSIRTARRSPRSIPRSTFRIPHSSVGGSDVH